MSKLVAILSLYLWQVYSSPCVPANTCFPVNIGDSEGAIPGDNAVMWTCNSEGKVTKTTWKNNDRMVCDRVSAGNDKTSETINQDGSTGRYSGSIHTGLITDGSGSGAISTDFLQGANCPNLDSSSVSCGDYMVIKRYGNVAWIDPTNDDELAYQDIGKCNDGTCTDATGACQGKGEEADFFIIPVGCVRMDFAGSNDFWTNGTHWGYRHWTNDDCTGTLETAQSDFFVLGECGVFAERTHCGGNTQGSQTICSTGGVLVTYDYYFDALCMPAPMNSELGVPTCDSMYDQSNAPTVAGQTPTPTKAPNNCPSCPSGTPKPTTKAPTTGNPTNAAGTGKPTTTPAPTTKSPTVSPRPTPWPTNDDGTTGPKSNANTYKFIVATIIGCILPFIM